MDQLSPRTSAFARFASPLFNPFKRAVTAIGVFTDTKAYKNEITRYEGEIQQNVRYENESHVKIEADEREAAIP